MLGKARFLVVGYATVASVACGGAVAADPNDSGGTSVVEASVDSGVAVVDSGSIGSDTSGFADVWDTSTDDGVAVAVDAEVPTPDEACKGTSNVIALSGEPADPLYSAARHEEPGAGPGVIYIRSGDWRADGTAAHNYIAVNFLGPSTSWELDFSTEHLGSELGVGSYPAAQVATFADPGHPGLDISGDGVGCNTLDGSFEISEVRWEGATLKSFTATFVQHCDGIAPALRGCVHFQE